MRDAYIETIRRRADLVAIVEDYVVLKRGIGDMRKGKCPFHNDSGESFFVSATEQKWHCFGSCNATGDAIDFLMRINHISEWDAAKQLGARLGLPEKPRQLSKSSPNNSTSLVLSLTEAGKLLNLSRPTMYKLYSEGKLPTIRFGRKVVIPRAALEKMLGDVKPSNPM